MPNFNFQIISLYYNLRAKFPVLQWPLINYLMKYIILITNNN